MKLLSCALVTVLAALALAGCTAAPDRRVEADALESALRAMPGVAGASTSYENGGSRGASMLVDVSMPDATDDQVVGMVRQMNASMGRDFDEYYLPITVSLGTGVRLRSTGTMDPAATERDVVIGRTLQRDVEAKSVTVSQTPTGPRIEITDATTSLPAVGTAVQAVGSVAAEIQVYPANSGDQLIWDVTTPLSDERLRGISADVERLPARAYLVAVRDGQISRLSVDVDASAPGALDTLGAVVGRLGAGPGRPLALNWTSGTQTDGADKRTAGSVSVGTCDYPKTNGEQNPERFFTDAARTVQSEMRSRYDTCPR